MNYQRRDIPVQMAKDALQVQNAANIAGVVHSLAKITEQLHCHECCEGTEWINKHPVVVLFVAKLADLTGLGHSMAEFSEAYTLCKKIAEEEPCVKHTGKKELDYE